MTVQELLKLKWIVIICVCAVCFYLVCKVNHIFTSKNIIKKASKDNASKTRSVFWSNLLLNCLDRLAFIGSTLNGGISESTEYLWKFRLSRMPFYLKSINHTLTVFEFVGLLKFISIAVNFIGLGVALTGHLPVGCGLIIGGFLLPFLFGKLIDMLIQSDDDALMIDFVNFYLAILPPLKSGRGAKLEPSVERYYRTLLELYPEEKDHAPLKRFVQEFLHLLQLYPTEVIALSKLKEIYTISDINTFCNYASQALRGIDNVTNLESFQHDLMEKQKAALRLVGMRRAEIAQLSVYAVYIILFEVVGVCILSKLGFDDSIFTFLKEESTWSE